MKDAKNYYKTINMKPLEKPKNDGKISRDKILEIVYQ